MQAEWTLQVEQRIEQLRVAFSLLDIEGMVYLYILSNESGSLGRKVRTRDTGAGSGRSRRSAQCGHQRARGHRG